MELHVFPIPIPPPTSLSTRFLWVFPVHPARALVSCIPPGLVILIIDATESKSKKQFQRGVRGGFSKQHIPAGITVAG